VDVQRHGGKPLDRDPVSRDIQLASDGFLEPLKGQVLQPYWIYVALLTVAAAILVAATGPANLSRTQPKQVAVP
jgi:hypothetical protein